MSTTGSIPRRAFALAEGRRLPDTNRRIGRRFAGFAIQAFVTFAMLTVFPVIALAGGLLVALLTLWPLSLLYHLGSRLRPLSIEFVLRKDKRPPVLYLRSFSSHDRIFARRRGFALQLLLAWLPWERLRLIPRLTVEEAFASAFQAFGPVIAIGDEQKTVDILGAARSYPDTGRWHDYVDSLMRRASVIIAIPSDSEGVLWELDHAFFHHLHCPLVIVVPPTGADRRHRPGPTESDDRWHFLRSRLSWLPAIDALTAAIACEPSSSTVRTFHYIQANTTRFTDQLAAIRRHFPGPPGRSWLRRSTSVLAKAVAFIVTYIAIILAAVAVANRIAPSDLPVAALITAGVITVLVLNTHHIPLLSPLVLSRTRHGLRTAAPLDWSLRRLGAIAATGLLVAIPLLVTKYVVEVFTEPTISMSPTMPMGTTIVVRKFGVTAHRGDVVIARVIAGDTHKAFAKRVVAIGGDVLRIRGARVEVNGKTLSVCHVGRRELLAEDGMGKSTALEADVWIEDIDGRRHELVTEDGHDISNQVSEHVIPEGHVFLLGDNRTSSWDSRAFGTVRVDRITGNVILVSNSWRLIDAGANGCRP